MRKNLLAAALLSVIALGAGCSKTATSSDKPESAGVIEAKVPTITVDEVDKALASNDCQPVDANGTATRKKMGVLPGAVLLTDSSDFKVSELPTDKTKPLVFYCANTQCGASHGAATKAITAGYTNVKVMPDGIAGWVKAGKPVSQI